MLRIEITPWLHKGTSAIELRIEVDAFGERIYYNKVLLDTVFLSMWERVMDEAKIIIKEHALNLVRKVEADNGKGE